MRNSFALAAILSVCAFAQSPTDVFEKAPPEVDAALRARVAKFFQAHVEGKFRQAEEVIAEDSKDAFYNSEKQRFIGFEIVRINYSNNFTKADVVTNVEIDWYTARLGKMRVKPPMKTQWKFEAGQWWWYVIPKKEWETPFGIMKPGAENTSNAQPQRPVIPDVESVLKQVQVDKTDISLKSAEASEDSAHIVNNMPGDLTLEVEPSSVAGLKVTIDKLTLHKGESAKLTFQYNPPDRSAKVSRTIRLRTIPTAQIYTFNLTFAVPPEMQKYLPKNQAAKVIP